VANLQSSFLLQICSVLSCDKFANFFYFFFHLLTCGKSVIFFLAASLHNSFLWQKSANFLLVANLIFSFSWHFSILFCVAKLLYSIYFGKSTLLSCGIFDLLFFVANLISFWGQICYLNFFVWQIYYLFCDKSARGFSYFCFKTLPVFWPQNVWPFFTNVMESGDRIETIFILILWNKGPVFWRHVYPFLCSVSVLILFKRVKTDLCWRYSRPIVSPSVSPWRGGSAECSRNLPLRTLYPPQSA